MKIATCTLKSISPLSQSQQFKTDKTRDESHNDHDQRCWKERCHVTDDGKIFIPANSFKNSLSEATKYKSMRKQGKGTETWTKHFEAGIIVTEPMVLNITIDQVKSERLFVPADGKRGGAKRVWKTFPLINKWDGVVSFLIVDDEITEEVFEKYLEDAGQFIGVGRFRPRNNGYYGRFEIVDVSWS